MYSLLKDGTKKEEEMAMEQRRDKGAQETPESNSSEASREIGHAATNYQ